MKIDCVPMPKFVFALSADQVRVLVWLSDNHYDGVCRLAAQVGGFLNGYRNCLNETTCVADVSATWREMDIMCKLMEMTLGLNEPDVKTARALQNDIHQAMRAWNNGPGKLYWNLMPGN